MHADEIGFGECGFKPHVLDLRFIFLNAALTSEIHQGLNSSNVFVVLVRRVVAQDVHVHSGALLDHRQADSPGADDCNRLAC